MSNEGRVLADSPSPPPFSFERTYTFRDYFRGARLLARSGTRGVYVSRTYRSEARDRLEIAFSVPVLDEEGQQLGLIAAPFNAKGGAFGPVPMEDFAGSGRIVTALLAPRGNDRIAGPNAPPPSDFTFLVHPGMSRGAEHTLRAPSGHQLRAAFGPAGAPGEQYALQYVPPLKLSDYRDPIPGFSGSWLAAFAPVGKTGFVVLVQTPKDQLRWPSMLATRLAAPVGLAVGLGLPLIALGATSLRKRRARGATTV
jgi:serine/threonine-protein kinase